MGGTGGGDEAGGGSDAPGGGAPASGGGVSSSRGGTSSSGGGSAQGGGMSGNGGGSFAGGGTGGGTRPAPDAGQQGGGFGGGTAGMPGGGSGGFGGGSPACGMFPGTGGGGFIATGGGMGGGAGGSACPPPLPAPGALPWGEGFQPQGSQRVQIDGGVCSGRIALGVGDRAVCYTHSDGSLRCAGAIYQTTFGPQFTAVPGQMNVDQILVAPTANSATGNALCIHRTDHTAWCMGDFNSHGQFANGDTCPQNGFVQWDNATNVDFLATGTWDQICALESGTVRCAGYGFGVQPITVPGLHSTAWVDTFGFVHVDDPGVFRAADYRSECWVTSGKSFHCIMGDLGTPCTAVNGTAGGMPMPPPMGPPSCLLDTSGHVQCTDLNNFSQGVVLALGGNFYSSDVCVVYADGSLWCRGQNFNGELGTGDSMPVPAERQVQPAGSVRLGCP
jgi:hypothetical protein